MGEEDRFTIILPTYEESDNIESMVTTLRGLYPHAGVLVMDDDSDDGTADIVRAMGVHDDMVSVVVREDDRGLSASILDGIMNVDTERFVVMDADFQHPTEAVGRLVEALDGSDLAVGVRSNRGPLPFMRRVSSWGADFLASSYLAWRRQPRCHDNMSGLFAGDTGLCQAVIAEHGDEMERRGFKALFDLLKFLPRDARVREVPFEFHPRRGGQSKLDARVVISILRQCGPLGKAAGWACGSLLTSMVGRFIGTLLIAFLTTLVIASALGEWDEELLVSVLTSLGLAVLFLMAASELIRESNRHGIIFGMKMVAFGLLAYFVNVSFVILLSTQITPVQVMSCMTGITAALAYNIVFSGRPSTA